MSLKIPSLKIHFSLVCALLLSVLPVNAQIVYEPGPVTIDNTEQSIAVPAGLHRDDTSSGTLYFRYTVDPISDHNTEEFFAGLQLYEAGVERLGVGNGGTPHAYSAFNASTGDVDLNSATPASGFPWEFVQAGQTRTLVFRVNYQPGALDNISVWLEPEFGLKEADQNASLLTAFTANASFDEVRLREGTVSSPAGADGWTFSEVYVSEQSPFSLEGNYIDWIVAGTGDWATGSNWSNGIIPEGAEFEEIAIVDNGGTATLNSVPTSPEGIILGWTSGQSGALEFGSGGSLNVVGGGVIVGDQGTGHLTIGGGGSLGTDFLRLGGETGSTITLGGGAGLDIQHDTMLGRTTRIIGSGNSFRAFGNVLFESSSILVAEITGSSHTPVSVTGTAELHGKLQVEFNGHTPNTGDSWTLVDASGIEGGFDEIEIIGGTPLGTGQWMGVRLVPGGDNGMIAQLFVASDTPRIGFNFAGGGPIGSGGELADSDVAGISDYPQSHWNNLLTDWDGSGSGDGTAPNAASRQDASGTEIPDLRLWWDAPNPWGKSTPLSTPDEKLMGGYLDSDNSGDGSAASDLYTSSAQPFFAVSGLPSSMTEGGYKVIVYADTSNFSGRIGEYWLTTNRGQNLSDVGGERRLASSVFLRDIADFTGTYTRATDTADTGAGTSSGNYVVFESLIEPDGFIVRAEEGDPSQGSPPRVAINAVQIIRNELTVVTTHMDELDPVSTSGDGISLREAVRDAPSGSGIIFDSSLSGQTITLTMGQILVDKNLTIDASGLVDGITIDANNASRIFEFTSGTTGALVSLTLINGLASGGFPYSVGGAIYVDSDAVLTVLRSTLSGNSALNGGGIFNQTGTTLFIVNSTLSGNSADNAGGGILNNGGALTIANSTFSGNSGGSGGGIFNNLGTLTVENSVFSDNSSTSGGGIYSHTDLTSLKTTVIHSTFFNNTATVRGGAFNNVDGRSELIHCTITGNTAPAGEGSGVASWGNSVTETVVEHSIISGNTNSDVDLVSGTDNSFTSSGYNLIGSGNDLTNFNVTGDTTGTTDPQLASLGDYGGPTQTTPPLPGSPAIDAGDTTSPYSFDQRGYARVVNGNVDIGAVEVQSTIVLNNSDSGTGSLRETILAASPGATVTFDAGLSDQTILLTSGQITVGRDLAIDASALPEGITIDGNANGRIFEFTSGTTSTLDSLVLTGGDIADSGGAILNAGDLTLVRTTVANSTTSGGGGGIFNNSGTLVLESSTVADNTAAFGGGIWSENAALQLVQSTISGNDGLFGSGGLVLGNGTAHVENTIVANNTGTGGADLGGSGTTVTRDGSNLIGRNGAYSGDFSGGLPNGSGDFVGTGGSPLDPQLAALGDYGGPADTMPPLPGSPAIDAGGTTALTEDQRGFTRVVTGIVDIGAVEVQVPFSRLVFYNNSAWDGDLGASANDDNAIATDKSTLLPGGVATLANYTSYSRGINGVMIDIAGLTGTPTLADFEFAVGNDDDPSGWASAPDPLSPISTRDIGGGVSRVTLIWNANNLDDTADANEAVVGAWLEVTVKATANTGLSSDDVFYFGNAIGETGNDASNARVNTADVLLIRNNPKTFLDPAIITDVHDLNRDTKVNAQDRLLARNHKTTFLDELKLIDLSGGASATSFEPVDPATLRWTGSTWDAAMGTVDGESVLTFQGPAGAGYEVYTARELGGEWQLITGEIVETAPGRFQLGHAPVEGGTLFYRIVPVVYEDDDVFPSF